jgi:hypothetical protein
LLAFCSTLLGLVPPFFPLAAVMTHQNGLQSWIGKNREYP